MVGGVGRWVCIKFGEVDSAGVVGGGGGGS